MKTALLERTRPVGPEEAPGWEPAAADRPCPVCGAAEGCEAAPAEGLARCRSAVSVHPVVGGGWLHLLPPED